MYVYNACDCVVEMDKFTSMIGHQNDILVHYYKIVVKVRVFFTIKARKSS